MGLRVPYALFYIYILSPIFALSSTSAMAWLVLYTHTCKYYQGLSRRQMNGEQQCFNEFQLFIRIISPEKQP